MEVASTKPKALVAVGIAFLAAGIAGGRLEGVPLDLVFAIAIYHGVRGLIRRFVFGLTAGFSFGALFLGPFYELLVEHEADRRPDYETQVEQEANPQPDADEESESAGDRQPSGLPAPFRRPKVWLAVAAAGLVFALIYLFGLGSGLSCDDAEARDTVMELFNENTLYTASAVGVLEDQTIGEVRLCEGILLDTDGDSWDISYTITRQREEFMVQAEWSLR